MPSLGHNTDIPIINSMQIDFSYKGHANLRPINSKIHMRKGFKELSHI